MDRNSYGRLLRSAYRLTRRADEAEDLLHSVLLAAVDAGRADMSVIANRNWVLGALKKRALFDARSAIRRKRREDSYAYTSSGNDQGSCEGAKLDGNGVHPSSFTSNLPVGLRITALLILTGHSWKEIAWLQRLSDAALRQRIAEIKRRRRSAGGQHLAEMAGLRGEHAFGNLRKRSIRLMAKPIPHPAQNSRVVLVSHDPNGHVFMVTSQNGSHGN